MWFTRFILFALLNAHLSRAETAKHHCPTVTTTATVCPTCIVKECLAISTISNPPRCPSAIPTVTTAYPCRSSTCPDGCASTQYVYASCYGEASITTTPCPTVTSVLGHCSTCVMPMCMAISTIKSVCGCPEAVPTETTSYACGGRCVGGCAGTEYVYETAAPTC
ncbi:hypothetical protein B0J13DRAFT_138029 [Dactylonectria estremocensis]|uniref:Uncharacterized protein n=1 Tax=Dactylonectria estremocensis TaxID=1079267 RepID=A0A9P9IQI8_9HYPO|nr:hypothetical protein B0J13DRAFT_138029 [Dactylonectria estremocensis]